MSRNFHCSSVEFKPVAIRLPIRLYMKATDVSSFEALNCGRVSGEPIHVNIGDRLKATMNKLKSDGLDIESGKVHYHQLIHSQTFEEYVQLTTALQYFDPSLLTSEAERKAFWINMYNVLMIHGVIAYGAEKSVLEIKGAFERIAYIIGGIRYSLDDIEHGILRGNRAHIVVPGVRFQDGDPRKKHVLNTFDPRIHFALVCASNSCPPIGIYTADELDSQLDLSAKNFVNYGGVVLNKAKMAVSLSRIFQWYSSDFGGRWMGLGSKVAVLRYISAYLLDESDAQFVANHAENLNVTYQKYDWSLNA